jgi:hypothetical protein
MLHQGVRVRDIATSPKWKPISERDMMLVHVIMPKAEEVAAPAEAARRRRVRGRAEVIKKGKKEEAKKRRKTRRSSESRSSGSEIRREVSRHASQHRVRGARRAGRRGERRVRCRAGRGVIARGGAAIRCWPSR